MAFLWGGGGGGRGQQRIKNFLFIYIVGKGVF